MSLGPDCPHSVRGWNPLVVGRGALLVRWTGKWRWHRPLWRSRGRRIPRACCWGRAGAGCSRLLRIGSHTTDQLIVQIFVLNRVLRRHRDGGIGMVRTRNSDRRMKGRERGLGKWIKSWYLHRDTWKDRFSEPRRSSRNPGRSWRTGCPRH